MHRTRCNLFQFYFSVRLSFSKLRIGKHKPSREWQRINITRSHLAVWHCFTCVLPFFFLFSSILRLMEPWNIIKRTIADSFDCDTVTNLQFDLLAKVREYIFQYLSISFQHIFYLTLSLGSRSLVSLILVWSDSAAVLEYIYNIWSLKPISMEAYSYHSSRCCSYQAKARSHNS